MNCTVIIPAYNTARYIGECLASVLTALPRAKVLVVDDGSTDDTVKEVMRFMTNQDVSLICQKHQGVTEALRIGIECAQTDVCTIVDSDDKLSPFDVSEVVRAFVNPQVGLVWTKFVCSNNRNGWSKPLPNNRDLLVSMLTGWWGAAHHKWFRKSWYKKSKGLDPKYDRSADFQLVFRLAQTRCGAVHLPMTTYWYRVGREGSITMQGPQKQREVAQQIIRDYIDDAKDQNDVGGRVAVVPERDQKQGAVRV